LATDENERTVNGSIIQIPFVGSRLEIHFGERCSQPTRE
jgi:hypothetical protein